jgi:hypothetical protein
MNKTPVVVGSSLSAIGSSLVATATAFCCIGPAVIAVTGTSGALAAARLAPFRSYFIIGSVLLLGVGFWMAYRPQGVECPANFVPVKNVRNWHERN